MLRLLALLPALFASGAAFAQEAVPVETVPLWQGLVMLLFLLLAALIVVSVLCRLVIALGLVPMKPKTRFHRVMHWLARVVSNVERKESRRTTAGGSSTRGGGGSFGGGGSSGNY
jgi:uncharacterized membrane protein YgcG